MKKLSVFMVLAVLSITAFGQNNKLTSAWSYHKDGFLKDAKEAIDEAEVHPKTKDLYKTHYYKGQIYQDIGISEKPKYQALCDNCFDVAYESYIKALKLNLTNPEDRDIDFNTELGLMKFVKILQENDERNYEDTQALIDIISNRFPALSNAFINQGVTSYQANDYETAYANFEKAIQISTMAFKVDTQLYYFASLAALKAEKFEEAIELNKVLLELNYGATAEDKAGLYLNQATAYKITGDTVKMLETLQEGIEKYPENNYPLVIETFNYYVNIGENEKAFEYITIAIEKNPNDPQFFVIKGTLLEELGRKQEAQKEYAKAIELQPDNFDANYSLGAFYYNTAVDTLDWADKNIPITEFAKLDQYKKIANEYFELSLPYLEKAYAQQPKNVNVLGTLRVIYYRLQKMEEYEKIKGELDALTE
jgi:tetratricopeptide (TPR) repeat protein